MTIIRRLFRWLLNLIDAHDEGTSSGVDYARDEEDSRRRLLRFRLRMLEKRGKGGYR